MKITTTKKLDSYLLGRRVLKEYSYTDTASESNDVCFNLACYLCRNRWCFTLLSVDSSFETVFTICCSNSLNSCRRSVISFGDLSNSHILFVSLIRSEKYICPQNLSRWTRTLGNNINKLGSVLFTKLYYVLEWWHIIIPLCIG